MSEITTTLTGFSAATIEKKRAVDAVQEGAQSTTGTAEYTFDVSNMDLFYDEYQALKDINMKIRKNEITALIGPSGCGKSTFLKTLNRMNDWVEGCRVTGDIRFEGQDIFKEVDPLALRYRVGMVFQQPTPFPKSIYENIAYGPRIQGIKDKKQLDAIVEKSLRQAACWDEMKDRLNKSALGLSGGQQQRVSIARALARGPAVILADEPTGALDSHTSREVLGMLQDLHKQGNTVVLITHDNSIAVQAERIIRLEDGRVVYDGDAHAPEAVVQPNFMMAEPKAGEEGTQA